MDLKQVRLASRVYECVLVRYAAKNKEYKCYYLNVKVIIESKDVEFYEDNFPFKSRNSGGTETNHIPVIRNNESNDKVEIEL